MESAESKGTKIKENDIQMLEVKNYVHDIGCCVCILLRLNQTKSTFPYILPH